MDPKTKELVESAEQRAEKATPGPWFDSRYHDDQFGPHVEDDNGRPIAFCDLGVAEHDHNGRFIEHARVDVPALCVAVREQDKRARHAEQERDVFNKRIAELEAQVKERDDAAKAWDALAVARLKTINEQSARIQDMTIEMNQLRSLVGDEFN